MPASRDRMLLIFGVTSRKWSPPKGGIEPGESIVEGAKRECREETGICIDFPTDTEHINIRKQHYFSLIVDDAVLAMTLVPQDICEVECVKWMTWDEIDQLPRDACNAITMELRRPATRQRVLDACIHATVADMNTVCIVAPIRRHPLQLHRCMPYNKPTPSPIAPAGLVWDWMGS
jgi:8-oxo-dGTP pyrophosphatase MutT (NUDIX family)